MGEVRTNRRVSHRFPLVRGGGGGGGAVVVVPKGPASCGGGQEGRWGWGVCSFHDVHLVDGGRACRVHRR